jgi:hypothetical protein
MQTEWVGPEMQLQLHGLLVASCKVADPVRAITES